MKSVFFIVGLLLGEGMMTATNALEKDLDALISHGKNSCLDLQEIKTRLELTENLTLPLEEELKLLEELAGCDLGRFLLENKGLNGYWTAYLIIHGPKRNDVSGIEKWVIDHSPAVKATQERFGIFQNQLQKQLKSGYKMASIPCGLMDDLLALDFSGKSDVELIGIDLDVHSLEMAKKNANQYGYQNASFLQQDAWDLNIDQKYDVITSNGLNIYQPDTLKVIELYKQFHKALKPDGIFITSFLTSPPALSKESPWVNYNPEDLLKQKAIFGDIIQASWQVFRTEAEMRDHLEQAGFNVLEVIYDTQRMFPTIVAQKLQDKEE